MPRSFTKQEREEIREELIENGRGLFIKYGLKKTGIRDLASSVGISGGSFYTFFPSKEELFFEILEREEETVKKKLLPLLKERLSRDSFKALLLKAFSLIESNPLLKTLLLGEEYRKLIQRIPEEKVREHIESDRDLLLPHIKKWQEEGMREVDPEALSGLLRAFFLLTLHREEIGEEAFEPTIHLFIDCLVRGLIKGSPS